LHDETAQMEGGAVVVRPPAQARLPQVVHLAKLMEDPRHLRLVWDEPGRELQRQHSVDVRQPHCRRTGHRTLHRFGRAPVEWKPDVHHVDIPRPELADELLLEHLGAAADERH